MTEGRFWLRRPWVVATVALLAVAAGGLIWKLVMREESTDVHPPTTIRDIVPAPVTVQAAEGVSYAITADTAIFTEANSATARRVGEYIANLLRPATSYPLKVSPVTDTAPVGGIALLLTGADPGLGEEGYRLDVTTAAVTIRANAPAGLFWGAQTLRQILPAAVESRTVQPGPWTVPGGRIVDRPRFAYRGVMLDVARHFFGLADIRRLIDLAALYKVNYLHLHLTDDQGWRIAIDSWPRLASFGGATEVGRTDGGGYYTQADYREIVAYAQKHFITVVPEVDLPGHTNAALASYAELNCDGNAPARYTGTEVGFSALCVDKNVTYRFLDDVFGELAELTPGPYLHIGGDEAKTLSPEAYSTIVSRAQEIVSGHGKTAIGWHEVAAARLLTETVAQFWGTTPDAPEVVLAAKKGNRVIMSPASRAYLDMKYSQRTQLGQAWAGYIEISDAYDWDPATYLPGVDEAAVLGVESPLWTETIAGIDDIEEMTFPRLPAIAELGWSPTGSHEWDGFRERLGAQAPRWDKLGVNFYRSPQIPWVTQRP